MLNSLDEIEFVESDKILGEGAFAEVVKVKSKKDGKFYALKKVDIKEFSKAECKNLKDEIKFHKTFQHDNIISFIDALQIKNMVYFLLEYASNGSLYYYINVKRGLPVKIAMKFFYDSCKAVKYIHDRNIIHRDIKPENLLVD